MEMKEASFSFRLTAEQIIDQILVSYEEDERIPANLPTTYEDAVKEGWEIALGVMGDGSFLLKISRKS